MPTEIPTLQTIIKTAGGAKAIAKHLSGSVSEWAIYKWPTSGIPDRYWPAIVELAGVDVEKIFQANEAARRAASKTEAA